MKKHRFFALLFISSILWSSLCYVPSGLATSGVRKGEKAATTVKATQAKSTQIMAWNFDWDDNIMYMPTKIYLFSKKDDSEIGISTGKFAEVRSLIGKEGEFKDYEIRPDRAKGSFREFSDDSGKNFFLDHVMKQVLKGDPSAWQAPSWQAFIAACSREETARVTTIITARGHKPETMMTALKFLQEHYKDKGLFKYLPPIENMHAVAGADNPSAAKAEIMLKILDRIDATPIENGVDVVTPDGKSNRPMHLWGFSDDDFGNFEKAREVLAREMKAGRWKHTKITLFYTGDDKRLARGAYIVTPDGGLRKKVKGEWTEVSKLLRKVGCPWDAFRFPG